MPAEGCCWTPVIPTDEAWAPQPRVVTLEDGGHLVLDDCGFLTLEEA